MIVDIFSKFFIGCEYPSMMCEKTKDKIKNNFLKG